MTKKEFLSKILSIIGKQRALAQAIKILLESNELSETFMNGLMNMMDKFIETTTDLKKKEVMKKGKDMIKNLQKKETKEKEINQKELDQLEDLINNVT